MEAFVHDPLINWRLLAPKPAAGAGNTNASGGNADVPNTNSSNSGSDSSSSHKESNDSNSTSNHKSDHNAADTHDAAGCCHDHDHYVFLPI